MTEQIIENVSCTLDGRYTEIQGRVVLESGDGRNAYEKSNLSEVFKEQCMRRKISITIIGLPDKAVIGYDRQRRQNRGRKQAWAYVILVMAAVAVRKKVVSIGHFSPCFYL